ncbi:MAG TPA: CoA transferase [Acidimicrobiales bacterium]|nr:CoA transferase [Acidimicrobiales bacterium]
MFEGVRVLEVGTWVMVPGAGVLLADFGADVIKVEHARSGDPARGLVTGGLTPTQGTVNLMVEQVNRAKRSIGLDLGQEAGRQLLYELAGRADVFLTSFLPDAREKLRIDVDDIRAVNPGIVYAKADAVGPAGPEGGKPGYDAAVFFGRGGILNSFSVPDGPLPRPRPGFGDKTASLAIAYGIAAALFRREREGVPAVVDVSLLGSAMWVASSDIVYSAVLGSDFSRVERPATNPVATHYATSDGRWIMLSMLESQRWWAPLCRALDRADLVDDPRYADAASRAANAAECRAVLAEIFAAAPLEEWRRRLAALRAPWEVVADSAEVARDPQAEANGYITTVQHPGGESIRVVRAPVTFDGRAPEVGTAPEFAQHTEEVLLELGHGWDRIAELKADGVIP